MALDARHRSSIYVKLVPLLGEDDANALMSEFPALEADELVTKQFLRAELALTRSELHLELAAVRNDVRIELDEFRTEVRGDVGGLRAEVAELRIGMADLRTELIERLHRQSVAIVAVIGAATVLEALSTILTRP